MPQTGLCLLFMEELTVKTIQYSADRHTKQHAQYAEGAASDGDGHQHEDAGQTHGFAYHLGINQISLKLLQNHNKHNKPERFDRLGQ